MKNKLIISAITLILLLGMGGYFLYQEYSSDSGSLTNETTQERGVNDIDYSPSTDEDKEFTENLKQNIDEDAVNTEASISITRYVISAEGANIGAQFFGFSSESCTITIADLLNLVNETVESVEANGISGCNAEVNTDILDENADWTLTVTAENGDDVVTESIDWSVEQRQ